MSKSEESQVNTLIYSMGQKADDILQSSGLSEEEEKKYNMVKEKFEGYFIQRRNLIFECKSKCVVVQPQPRIQIAATDAMDTFLGPIYVSDISTVQANSTKWIKSLDIHQCKMAFKIDPGADVTVILENFYSKTHDGLLRSTDQLTGAGQLNV